MNINSSSLQFPGYKPANYFSTIYLYLGIHTLRMTALLPSQRKHLLQNGVVAGSITPYGIIRRREHRLLDLGVLSITDEDEVSVSGLVDHEVCGRARDDGGRLAVLRDGGQEALQVGENLGCGPRGGEGVDADGEAGGFYETGEPASEA